MTEEDEKFNRIEREASLRKAAVLVAITKKEWIDLTDKDIDAIYLQHHTRYGEGLSVDFGYERAILDKFKDKNT
jgi:hypothetical protein